MSASPPANAPHSRDAALERFAAIAAGTDPDTIAARMLAAELAILEAFDLVRHSLGHDYGVGQRRAELNRRGLKLRRIGNSIRARRGDELVDAAMLAAGYDADRYRLELRDTPPLSDEELRQAFAHVARPRWRRLEREDFRRNTPGNDRTRRAWTMTASRFARLAKGAR